MINYIIEIKGLIAKWGGGKVFFFGGFFGGWVGGGELMRYIQPMHMHTHIKHRLLKIWIINIIIIHK